MRAAAIRTRLSFLRVAVADGVRLVENVPGKVKLVDGRHVTLQKQRRNQNMSVGKHLDSGGLTTRTMHPHACTHIGVHRTCGEPNGIDLAAEPFIIRRLALFHVLSSSSQRRGTRTWSARGRPRTTRRRTGWGLRRHPFNGSSAAVDSIPSAHLHVLYDAPPLDTYDAPPLDRGGEGGSTALLPCRGRRGPGGKGSAAGPGFPTRTWWEPFNNPWVAVKSISGACLHVRAMRHTPMRALGTSTRASRRHQGNDPRRVLISPLCFTHSTDSGQQTSDGRSEDEDSPATRASMVRVLPRPMSSARMPPRWNCGGSECGTSVLENTFCQCNDPPCSTSLVRAVRYNGA